MSIASHVGASWFTLWGGGGGGGGGGEEISGYYDYYKDAALSKLK